ncbi:MAG TPA: histidine phosphatase family protein [Stellaceae bacterium]|nr:histidine phosphatase family protein [Stellaceae bacterium]
MHRLHLLRHAKSSWDDAVDDHERNLNRRGRDEATRVGKHLPMATGSLDLVLCSTARRAVETMGLVLARFAPPPRSVSENGLYLAGADKLLQRLARLDEDDHAVLVIGHNPGLHELALALASPASPRFDALAGSKFPTAVRASFKIAGPWSSLDRGPHELTDYVTVKSLSD